VEVIEVADVDERNGFQLVIQEEEGRQEEHVDQPVLWLLLNVYVAGFEALTLLP
jgi:hypothetical protein